MHGPGHNKSPLDVIQDLYDEAENWLDGEPLETKKQHDTLIELIRQLRAARTAADEARKEEAKPFDEGKKAIQAKYNPFIQPQKGMVDRAIASAKTVLEPYLLEQTRIKRENDERLAAEAAQAMTEAKALMKSSAGDLAAREEAEQRLEDATEAEKIAKRAIKQNVAKGSTSRWDVELVDRTEAARWLWSAHTERFDELLLQVAKERVAGGSRTIPGFTITERITV
jgi:hypothetical protein